MRVIKYGKHGRYFLFDAASGDGGAGGGGAGAAGGAAATGTPDPKDAKIAELEAKLKAAEGAGAGGGNQNDLVDKARKEKEDKEKREGDSKVLESAIKFDLEAESFLSTNKAYLPSEIADIFAQAKKENYGSSVEKSQALKSAIVQSFFSVQGNVDMLTPGQKSKLDDYLKLTKTVKQERSPQIYEDIFEPAFETLKRVKKAEALGKGHAEGGKSEDAYKQKMSAHSKEYYLGHKGAK